MEICVEFTKAADRRKRVTRGDMKDISNTFWIPLLVSFSVTFKISWANLVIELLIKKKGSPIFAMKINPTNPHQTLANINNFCRRDQITWLVSFLKRFFFFVIFYSIFQQQEKCKLTHVKRKVFFVLNFSHVSMTSYTFFSKNHRTWFLNLLLLFAYQKYFSLKGLNLYN